MARKIVLDIRRLKDFGIGTYIRNLVHTLAKIDRENRYVLVTFPADVHDVGHLPSNFDIATYARPDTDPADEVAFPIFVRSLSADLCHIPLNRVPLAMPKPYVVTIHDMSSILYEKHSGLAMSFRRYRFERGLLRAARIIAVSGATRRDLEHFLGIPHERISVVYNAPDPAFFRHNHLADARAAGPQTQHLERLRILERYQIGYPFLLYAGAIKAHKNVPRLVEAFALVREQLDHDPLFQELRLIIIGDEVSRNPAVRRAVMQSRVENYIRFLGFVPFDTLRAFYECATVFVFPSLYEGFGLPPLEAMASGTPVVTSSVSSLPEVVGDAAVLVDPEHVFDIARGIKEVLLNENLRHDLVRRGREQASRFSWERTARQVLEIYREVGK